MTTTATAPVTLTATQRRTLDTFLAWQGVSIAETHSTAKTPNRVTVLTVTLAGRLCGGRIGDVIRGGAWLGSGLARDGHDYSWVQLGHSLQLAIRWHDACTPA
jgi:hypothetical protein